MKFFEGGSVEKPTSPAENEGDIKEPHSGDEAISLLETVTQFVWEKFNKARASHQMGKAEQRLNPYGETTQFKSLQLDAMGKFGSDTLVEKLGKEVQTGDWRTYLKKAEALRANIREDVVKSYLALRKARTVASPEEKKDLEELFKRQVEMMKLMHSPEYTNHIAALRKGIEENMVYSRGKLGDVSPKIIQETTEWTQTDGLSTEAVGILAKIEADIAREHWQELGEKNEMLLKDLDEFAETKKQ